MVITCLQKSKFNKYYSLLNSVANAFVSAMKINAEVEVNVSFVSCMKIKKINNENRGVNKVTDVLSFPTLAGNEPNDISGLISKENFPLDVNPENDAVVIGDIVFCLKQIKKQAKQFNNSLNRELGYMFVHGLLHLVGYDHMNETDKNLMRKKEEEILEKINLTREV